MRMHKDGVLMEISEMLDKTEILAQLAEEAAELAQAALQLRRAIDGENPTPESILECEAHLHEEIADVWLCIREAGFFDREHIMFQREIMIVRRDRWLSRLRKKEESEC